MLQFKNVERNAWDLNYAHKHLPDQSTLVSQRVLDAEKDAKIHMLAWRYNNHRGQWEAMCEKDDIIFISPGTEDDIHHRKGRSF